MLANDPGASGEGIRINVHVFEKIVHVRVPFLRIRAAVLSGKEFG